MARKRKADEGGGYNWLDTYADMVTLLLTFFVLLYASSNLDQQKWQYIYESIVSRGNIINPIVTINSEYDPTVSGDYIESKDLTQGGNNVLPESFDQLFTFIASQIEAQGLSDSVEIQRSKSNVYMSFQDKVFFAGDSYILLDDGKKVLDLITPGLSNVMNYIKQIRISGHTAKAYSEIDDWDLSTQRAVAVAHYLRDLSPTLENKFATLGFGPTIPISNNDTEEGRVKNRRVEIIIIRNDVNWSDPAVIRDLLKYDYQIDINVASGDDGGGTQVVPGAINDKDLDEILNSIDIELGQVSAPDPVEPTENIDNGSADIADNAADVENVPN